jgi:hypothetical protein
MLLVDPPEVALGSFGSVARLANGRLKLSKTKRATYMALFMTIGR